MIDGLQPYPAMKDSSGPPVREMPEDVEIPGGQAAWH